MSSPATDDAVIRTRRLVLRRVRPEADFAGIHAVLSDAKAMTYWSTPPHDSEAQTRDWLAAMAQTPAAEGDDFIIEFAGRAVGKAGFYRFPDIGYIIDPALWGQGLVAEALAPIIARAFDRHGLARNLLGGQVAVHQPPRRGQGKVAARPNGRHIRFRL
jgi:RimJ/RimL family protein N-acetyltransferase